MPKEENKEIKKFNQEDALNSVKDRIKDAFVSLIPDDQWNAMVKKEIDEYFKEVDSGYNYNNQRRTSKFQLDVHQVLTEEVKKSAKEYLTTNFQVMCGSADGATAVNKMVEEFMIKNSGKILADMLAGQVSIILQNAGYRM